MTYIINGKTVEPTLSNVNTGVWRVVLRHPIHLWDWYIYNTETGVYKKIGRVGAKRTNYYDQAQDEADRRNRLLASKSLDKSQ